MCFMQIHKFVRIINMIGIIFFLAIEYFLKRLIHYIKNA